MKVAVVDPVDLARIRLVRGHVLGQLFFIQMPGKDVLDLWVILVHDGFAECYLFQGLSVDVLIPSRRKLVFNLLEKRSSLWSVHGTQL